MLNSGSSGESLMNYLSNNLESCFVKITLAAVNRMKKVSGKDTDIVV